MLSLPRCGRAAPSPFHHDAIASRCRRPDSAATGGRSPRRMRSKCRRAAAVPAAASVKNRNWTSSASRRCLRCDLRDPWMRRRAVGTTGARARDHKIDVHAQARLTRPSARHNHRGTNPAGLPRRFRAHQAVGARLPPFLEPYLASRRLIRRFLRLSKRMTRRAVESRATNSGSQSSIVPRKRWQRSSGASMRIAVNPNGQRSVLRRDPG